MAEEQRSSKEFVSPWRLWEPLRDIALDEESPTA